MQIVKNWGRADIVFGDICDMSLFFTQQPRPLLNPPYQAGIYAPFDLRGVEPNRISEYLHHAFLKPELQYYLEGIWKSEGFTRNSIILNMKLNRPAMFIWVLIFGLRQEHRFIVRIPVKYIVLTAAPFPVIMVRLSYWSMSSVGAGCIPYTGI